MRNRRIWTSALCSFIVGLFGCHPEVDDSNLVPVGNVAVSIPLLNDECNVTSATVTITGDGLDNPIQAVLTVGELVSGTVDNIPVGTWQFLVQAFNEFSLEVYSGGVAAEIIENETTMVTLVMGRNLTNCPLASPEVESGTGSASINGALSNSMVHVPAGDFLVGIEEPLPTSFLDSFLIDIFEVSAADYQECVEAAQCTFSIDPNAYGYSYRTYDNDKEDHPINFVSWQQATDYCAWKNKRLPTQLEWEKAARGTDALMYSWDSSAGAFPNERRANSQQSFDLFEDVAGFGTTPVGYFDGINTTTNGLTVDSPSPYGAYDMVGNVAEWTDSWGTSALDLEKRAYRGGSHTDMIGSGDLMTGWERARPPETQSSSIGFRCAQ